MIEKIIVINTRFLTQPITGVQRYAIELCKELLQHGLTLKFVCPKNIMHEGLAKEFEAETIGTNMGHLWEQYDLPLYLKQNGNPLLLNLCNTGPIYYGNKIVVVHDLAFLINPEWFSKKFYFFYKFLIPKILRSSRLILTVSNNSKSDIVTKFDIIPDQVQVIYPGNSFIKYAEREERTKKNSKRDKKYILAVSSLDPRKNFKSLIVAFNKIESRNLHLYVIGSKSKSFKDLDLKEVLDKDPRIKFLGYVDESTLIEYYRNAELFIYPSFYEGFGFPPLEAMSFGCPTIVSKVASLPEVCGNASYYIDPYDVNSLKNGIESVLQDSNLREILIVNGYERASQFSWKRTANEFLSVLDNLERRYA